LAADRHGRVGIFAPKVTAQSKQQGTRAKHNSCNSCKLVCFHTELHGQNDTNVFYAESKQLKTKRVMIVEVTKVHVVINRIEKKMKDSMLRKDVLGLVVI
jgi:hypothetical protein